MKTTIWMFVLNRPFFLFVMKSLFDFCVYRWRPTFWPWICKLVKKKIWTVCLLNSWFVFETLRVRHSQDNDMYEAPHEEQDDSYEPPPSGHRVFATTPSASFPTGEYLGWYSHFTQRTIYMCTLNSFGDWVLIFMLIPLVLLMIKS